MHAGAKKSRAVYGKIFQCNVCNNDFTIQTVRRTFRHSDPWHTAEDVSLHRCMLYYHSVKRCGSALHSSAIACFSWCGRWKCMTRKRRTKLFSRTRWLISIIYAVILTSDKLCLYAGIFSMTQSNIGFYDSYYPGACCSCRGCARVHFQRFPESNLNINHRRFWTFASPTRRSAGRGRQSVFTYIICELQSIITSREFFFGWRC